MDYQAIGITVGSLATALGTIYIGIRSGNASRIKDRNQASLDMSNARFAREQAEENAARDRVDALSRDAKAARAEADAIRAARWESDAAYDIATRELRADRQRGWDLARHHWGLVSLLAQLIGNLLQSVADDPPPDRYVAAVKIMQQRMSRVAVPDDIESPVPRPPDPKP